MTDLYDLIVIGAGSAGLTAVDFALKLGAKVALVEKERIGGDCTWTGCVPSKALLQAAKMVHHVRMACHFGVCTSPPQVEMDRVRDYIANAVEQIYQTETPDMLREKGADVIIGAAEFLDANKIRVGKQTLSAKKFVICTGARPFIPPISGLETVPYVTYLQVFENEHLPERLLVIGAGPVGVEIAQAYQRLGSQVTLFDERLLPGEEPEVSEALSRTFAEEGMQFVAGLASSARQADNGDIELTVEGQTFTGDALLVAAGRMPNVDGLGLSQAGVTYSPRGILANNTLCTTARNIWTAGDCVQGNFQFTHVAGWQGYQAVRNALLPGNGGGFAEVTPRAIFTDPEVARVGLAESEAQKKFGNDARVALWPMSRVDRAVTDNTQNGFIKLIHTPKGKILGATIVAPRAGEMINEIAMAMKHNLKLFDVANVLHVYPSYSMGTMMLAAEIATEDTLNGPLGKIIHRLADVSGE